LNKNGTFTGGVGGVTDYQRDANGLALDNGKRDIFIAPAALTSFDNLFLALGHEMVHLNDMLTFGDDYSVRASEYNAYSWSIAACNANNWTAASDYTRLRDLRGTQNSAYSYNVPTVYTWP